MGGPAMGTAWSASPRPRPLEPCKRSAAPRPRSGSSCVLATRPCPRGKTAREDRDRRGPGRLDPQTRIRHQRRRPKAKLRLVMARALAPRARRPRGAPGVTQAHDRGRRGRCSAGVQRADSRHRRPGACQQRSSGAMSVLGKALLQEGPAARAAGEAIVAYPFLRNSRSY